MVKSTVCEAVKVSSNLTCRPIRSMESAATTLLLTLLQEVMMKICPRCGISPSVRNFKPGNAPYCTECLAKYNRERRQRNADRLAEFKDVPCADCGVRYPRHVMDLDHVRGIKVRAISSMMNYTHDRFDTELDKCEVVCSNCHRERTYSRSQTVKALD